MDIIKTPHNYWAVIVDNVKMGEIRVQKGEAYFCAETKTKAFPAALLEGIKSHMEAIELNHTWKQG